MRDNRYRGWWKPWSWSTRTWLSAIVLIALFSPLITRWIYLWQIPDVDLPFDVEDVVQKTDVGDEDAFIVYQNIFRKIPSQQTATVTMPGSVPKTPETLASLSREEIAQRLTNHDPEALSEFLRAGELPRAFGPSLKAVTLSCNLNFYQDLRQLSRTYNILGIAFDQAGEIEKAWACHRANLQCSIHAEQPGIAICALVGTACRANCMDGIIHWSANSTITAERLQMARLDIEREFARRISLFHVAKVEYLLLRNTMHDAEGVSWQLEFSPLLNSLPLSVKRVGLWLVGQPELTLRLARQILLNNRLELDKPLHSRRHAVHLEKSGQILFEADPAVPRISGRLKVEQLVRILESTSPLSHMQNDVLFSVNAIEITRKRDNARLAGGIISFAVQEYQRVHGHFPETLDQLVPSVLTELPYDPFDPNGCHLKYRRDADCSAVVWSIGENGIDDQGSIDQKSIDIGYRIQLRAPEKIESSLSGQK